MTVFKDKIVKAKKDHQCNAFFFIQEGIDNTMPPHTCAGIKAGDNYRNQVHNEPGDFCDFKMCLPCEEYARKYDLILNYY